MKTNKGVTFVELVIVLAIMGVLAGVAFMSVNSIFGYDVKECVNDLSGSINNSRMDSLSHGTREMKIYKDSSDNCYYMKLYDPTKEASEEGSESKVTAAKISTSKVKVEYFTDKTATTGGTEITGAQTLILAFDRSSGAFKKLGSTDLYCQKIIVSRGAKQAVILFYPETGKHYIQ